MEGKAMHSGTQRSKQGAKSAANAKQGTVDTARTLDANAGTVIMAAMNATAQVGTHQFGTAQLDS